MTEVNSNRGDYVSDLHDAQIVMSGAGYTLESLENLDAQPGDAEIASKYEASGQRARDQATVDKANAEGRTGYLPGSNQPFSKTDEEAAAAKRLKDFAAITDPYATSQARHLAAERLDDYNKSVMSGPLPIDSVLGGDARTRAQARLKLQKDLENGQLSWHSGMMTTDEATQLIDRMEAADRATTLAKVQHGLVAGGMSPEGAAAVAEGLAHGKVPKEYIDAVSATSKVLDGGKEAFKGAADAAPTGKHWAPGVAFSHEDVEALEKIGRRLGLAGNALEFGEGLYQVFVEDKSPVQVVTKTAGGMAGAWALGGFGAGVGGIIARPPGAFIGAFALGTLGAFGGEEAADRAYKWLAE